LNSLNLFYDYARFTEVLPSCTRLPAPPRFIFGSMPSEVAATYYGRQRLAATGVYLARDLTIDAGPLLWAGDQLLVAPELNLHRSQIQEIVSRRGPAIASKSSSYLRVISEGRMHSSSVTDIKYTDIGL
jgi:hypothetical protein